MIIEFVHLLQFPSKDLGPPNVYPRSMSLYSNYFINCCSNEKCWLCLHESCNLVKTNLLRRAVLYNQGARCNYWFMINDIIAAVVIIRYLGHIKQPLIYFLTGKKKKKQSKQNIQFLNWITSMNINFQINN